MQTYLETALAREDHAKEVKLFDLGRLFLGRYVGIFEGLYEEDRKLTIRRETWGFTFTLLSITALYGAYAWCAVEAVRGVITLGQMTMARVRIKDGLSYGVGSQLSVDSLDKSGSFLAYAIYAPQNLAKLEQAFKEEIERVLKDGFTAEEINKFRPGYLEGRSQGRANDNELVGLMIARRFAGRSLAWDEDFEKKIAALTPDQVNAALRKYIDPKKIIIVRAGDFAKNPPVKATP